MPVLEVESIETARRYYEEILGLRVVMDHGWIVTLADAGDPSGSQISLITRDATASVNPELSVEVDDVDLAHSAAIAAHTLVVHELRNEPWGVRRFFFRDDDGHVINVLAHLPSDSAADVSHPEGSA
ncbi:MAG: VOC family protein [Microbacterium enclense]